VSSVLLAEGAIGAISAGICAEGIVVEVVDVGRSR
jgi:hypothetical protein